MCFNFGIFIGIRQSPIDIETSTVHTENEIEVSTKYEDIKDGTLEFDGRNLRILYSEGYLTFKNYSRISEWQALNFHIHCPGEHKVDGKTFDAEMHMVFDGLTHEGELAVVGLLFEADEEVKEHVFLDSLRLHKIAAPDNKVEGLNISFSDLFGNLTTYENYHYQGSITFPGYDEISQWFIFTDPIKIPPSQVELLKDFWSDKNIEGCFKGNARCIQKTGSRDVLKVKHVHNK
jgi:carbonic anhydrase